MTNIICQSCGHENDSSRVFCQNCGIRLEVSEQTVTESTPSAPVVKKEKAKPGKQVAPGQKSSSPASIIANLFITLVEVSIVAALAAALIQAWRAPHDVLPKAVANAATSEQVIQVVREAAQSLYPRQVTVTQDQLNQYLINGVKLEPAQNMLSLEVKFDRFYMRLEQGAFDAVFQQSVARQVFYIDIRYTVTAAKSGATVTPVAAYIGRLPIHPAAVPYITRVMQPVWDSLGADIQLLGSTSNIVVSPGSVLLNFPGTAKK